MFFYKLQLLHLNIFNKIAFFVDNLIKYSFTIIYIETPLSFSE